MGSGLYRRSWTSLPTPFISAQRLSERTVLGVHKVFTVFISMYINCELTCFLRSSLPDQGGYNCVNFQHIPHATQKIDSQSEVRELTATILYLTIS
jgi:hypothetical protein